MCKSSLHSIYTEFTIPPLVHPLQLYLAWTVLPSLSTSGPDGPQSVLKTAATVILFERSSDHDPLLQTFQRLLISFGVLQPPRPHTTLLAHSAPGTLVSFFSPMQGLCTCSLGLEGSSPISHMVCSSLPH